MIGPVYCWYFSTCPTCPGFSRQLVAILNEIGVEYSSFNILADEEVRQGEGGKEWTDGSGKRGNENPEQTLPLFASFWNHELHCNWLSGTLYTLVETVHIAWHTALKSYSNWPTYPQLYVSGELIGGLDIVKVGVHFRNLSGSSHEKALIFAGNEREWRVRVGATQNSVIGWKVWASINLIPKHGSLGMRLGQYLLEKKQQSCCSIPGWRPSSTKLQ